MDKLHTSFHPTGQLKLSVCYVENKVEAIYVKFHKGKIAKSREIGPNGEVVVDLDHKGCVIGVEMLQPGKLSITKMAQKQIPELAQINMNSLQSALALQTA